MKNTPQHQNWISRMQLPAARVALALAALIPAIIATPSAQAQTLTVLYSFTGGTDGSSPTTGLIRDSAGNLYGTTGGGGAYGAGVVFKVNKTATETVLYNFMNSSDGGSPQSGLIRDTAGNLYGTTEYGGANNFGTVYKVTPGGIETVLYSFRGPGSDGYYPVAGVIQDTAGNFYGTTTTGGVNSGGTVYKLSSTGTETILHSFGKGTDGTNPQTGLIRSGTTLFGTTLDGGSLGVGTAWKLTAAGKETILHNFAGGQTDGAYPEGTLLLANGTLYGTAFEGGPDNPGIVYELTVTGVETVLHNFTGQVNDGGWPGGGVIRDTAGNLYGTTTQGGASNDGTVYELGSSGGLTVLYSFCSATNCTDGQTPYAGVVRDAAGNLYGTTEKGGAHGFGTVWKLAP